LRLRDVCPGETIVKEGEVGDCLYVVCSGFCDRVKVVNGFATTIGQHSRGHSFNEHAALYEAHSKFTIRATTAATVIALGREDLAEAVEPASWARMIAMARSEMMEEVPLFKGLSADQRLVLAQRLKAETFLGGEFIVAQGDLSRRLFLVESGVVSLSAAGRRWRSSRESDTSSESGLMHGGQYLGMLSLFYGSPICATACAAQPCEVGEALGPKKSARVLSLSWEDLEAACSKDPGMRTALEREARSFLLGRWQALLGLTREGLRALLARAELVRYRRGDVIVQGGAPMDVALMLETGSVVRQLDDPVTGVKRELGECVAPGTVVSDDCLGGPHACASCTVVAISDCTLLRMPLGILPGPFREQIIF